jgi:hypothetical protein
MGLSELLAELDFLHYGPAQRLPPGRYRIDAACPAELCRLRSAEQLGVHLLQLPYSVDAARVFRHRAYYVERSGRGLPVETAAACQVGDWCLVFL